MHETRDTMKSGTHEKLLKIIATVVWPCRLECLMECVVKSVLTLNEHNGTFSLT